MKHLAHLISLIILSLFAVACGGAVEAPEPLTCLEGDDYRFAYSAERAEYYTAIPGESLCYQGERTQWCIYRGDEPGSENNLLGPDATADAHNAEGCAPGSR
ncbi:MAG TPA: hypothetical protein VN764_00795 [Polyangiaceae bacterium]|nr:hypothetical protein [Polyangiaceae bacterium]